MKARSPIVLLTDFGTKDAYAATLKGVILSAYPQALIVDLTHEIAPQNVVQAAYVLEAAYPYFPKGSVFVTVVDPGVGSQRKILAVKSPAGIFLAPDNGILSRILPRFEKYEIRAVTNADFFRKEVSRTFHGRDCFAPAAARLAKTPSDFSKTGPKLNQIHRAHFPKFKIQKGALQAEVVYIDHFGNAFTNLARPDLEAAGKLSNYRIRIHDRGEIGPIRDSYHEVKAGEPLALFGSNGILELAVNQGSAAAVLNLKEGTSIEVFQKT